MISLKILSLFMMSALLAGCGAALQAQNSGSGGGTSIECNDNNCFQAKPQKVESIMNHRQILPSMTKCMNLNTASMNSSTLSAYNVAKAAFTESLPSFSLNGAAKDVSAPLMMSLMTVASEICTTRIEVEKSQNTGRQFFAGFNLNTSGANNNTETISIDNTIQAMSRSCWGRDATAKEITAIKNGITGQSSRLAALYACTAVLGSTQAIRF